MPTKNPKAVSRGKLRWKSVPKTERSKINSAVAKARWAKIPKEERKLHLPRSTGRPREFPRCLRYGSHRFSPTTQRCPCGYVRPRSR